MKTSQELVIDTRLNKLALPTVLCFEFFRQYRQQSVEFCQLKIKAQVISVFTLKNICS